MQEYTLAREVRAADYERFLAIQLAPSPLRPMLYALTAFHAELARIPQLVSEPMLGHMRYTWWREGVEEILAGGAPTRSPLLMALRHVYAHCPAAMAEVLVMIDRFSAAILSPELPAAAEAAASLHCAWAMVLDAEAANHARDRIATQARAYVQSKYDESHAGQNINVRDFPDTLRPLRVLERFARRRQKTQKEELSNVSVKPVSRLSLAWEAIQERFF